MFATTDLIQRQARERLPDEPRWVETRDLLAWDGAQFLGDAINFVVWSAEDDLGAIVGQPQPSSMLTAASQSEQLLAFAENIDHARAHLSTHHAERADIFVAPPVLEHRPQHPGRFLRSEELDALTHLPSTLLEELQDAREDGNEIYAVLDDALPVAFCYVASQTESLWDISIDTVESHRRKGFAQSAVVGLMERMSATDKTAVWGALESNPASRHLALKLGFVEVDELWVFDER